MPRAHPLAGLEAVPVGRRDREHGGVEVDGQVLELLGDQGDLLLLRVAHVGGLHLLEVVHDHQRRLAGVGVHLLDAVGDGAHVGLAVVERWITSRSEYSRSASAPRWRAVPRWRPAAPAVRRRRPPCRRRPPGFGRSAGRGAADQPRLHRDQPLEEHLRLELEGEHHRRATSGGGVAAHLEGHGRLALALRAGEHVEGTGTEPAADASSSIGNPVGQIRTSASGERSRASARSTTEVREVSF